MDRLTATHLPIGGKLFWNRWFLEPIDVVFRCRLSQSDCLRHHIFVIGINHETHVLPDRISNSANDIKIFLHPEANLDLAGLKPSVA